MWYFSSERVQVNQQQQSSPRDNAKSWYVSILVAILIHLCSTEINVWLGLMSVSNLVVKVKLYSI